MEREKCGDVDGGIGYRCRLWEEEVGTFGWEKEGEVGRGGK